MPSTTEKAIVSDGTTTTNTSGETLPALSSLTSASPSNMITLSTTTYTGGGGHETIITLSFADISSLTLTTTTLPNGERQTLASYVPMVLNPPPSFQVIAPLSTIELTTLSSYRVGTLSSLQSLAPWIVQSTSSTSPLGPTQGTDPSETSSKNDNTTKIALGVGVPLGVILIALLLAGGYFWGKRASQSRRKTQGSIAEMETIMGQEATESHELESKDARLELPTKFNIAETDEQREILELPPTSPVELPAGEQKKYHAAEAG